MCRGHGSEPETNNVKANHGNEPFYDLLVKVQRNFEQAGKMRDEEQQHSDDELRKQEE